MVTLGAMKLRRFLELRGITNSAFAERCNMTRDHLSHIIHGRKLATLVRAFAIENATNGEIDASEWIKEAPVPIPSSEKRSKGD